MSTLFKFIVIGTLSFFIGVFSFSIYADKGGDGFDKAGKEHGRSKEFSHSKGRDQPMGDEQTKKEQSRAKFSTQDRETIANYFATHHFSAIGLPPGIAKNLARGKPLPPGIAKQYLPRDLSQSLIYYPGYDYLIAGKDVLLVNKTNQIIEAILYDILR